MELQGKPIVINIEPTEETPREKEIRTVSEEARKVALNRLRNASNLTDYLRWHRAASFFLTAFNIDWMWDYGGITPEGLIDEQESDRFTKPHTQNAATAELLRSMIEKLPSQEGMVRMGLKRVKDHDAGIYEYRVLAAFPEGTYVDDPIDGLVKTDQQRVEEDVIFLEPENACVNHACDDLYKTHRNSAFYLPVRTLNEAIKELQTNRHGATEYLLEKTNTGSVKQDAGNYILVALLGGYSNERLRVRVSDYWNKTQPTATT